MAFEGMSAEQKAPQDAVAEGPRTDGPTLEEYVAAGYRAVNYPPAGYAERPTPALEALRAWMADLHSAEKHRAAADALGVEPGELMHGRVGDVDLERMPVNLTAAAPAVPAAEPAISAPAGSGILQEPLGGPAGDGAPRVDITALNADDAKAHVKTLTTREQLEAARADEAANAKFPGGRASVMRAIEERGTALFEQAQADAARLASLQDRRKNDPASLTAEEQAELERLEKLAGVEERRAAEQAGGAQG